MVPRRILALLATLALSLLAVADGIYLSMVHIDLEFGGGGIGQLCHRLSETGCAVTGGRFGDLLGIPVSVIGGAGAATCALLAIIALIRAGRPRDVLRDLLLTLAALSVLASVIMATLSLVEGKFCPFCVIWYGLNAGLLISSWVAITADSPPRGLRDGLRGGLSALPRLPGALPAVGFALWGVGAGANWVLSSEAQQRLGPDALLGRLGALDHCCFVIAQSVAVLGAALLVERGLGRAGAAAPFLVAAALLWWALERRVKWSDVS